MLIPKELLEESKQILGEEAAYIIAEELQLEQFDEKNLKSLCPFHDEKSGSFIWNSKNNSFHCFGCTKNFGILDLYMQKGMTYLEACERLFLETGIKFRFGEKGVKESHYKYPNREDSDRTQVENYFIKRGISNKMLDGCDVQSDIKNNIVWHFYDDNDVLCTVKYRSLKASKIKEWAQEGADTKAVLFNMNRIDVTQPLLITEGQIDCLSAIEAGFTNTVSVPFGAGSTKWIETCYDWLEQFSKVIIWADNDAMGSEMRKNVVGRLGEYRTYTVDLPKEVEKDR